MTDKWKGYKGYIIVPGASCSSKQLYTGSYQIFRVCDGDDLEGVHLDFCRGAFVSEHEACVAAEVAARAYIDASLPALHGHISAAVAHMRDEFTRWRHRGAKRL